MNGIDHDWLISPDQSGSSLDQPREHQVVKYQAVARLHKSHLTRGSIGAQGRSGTPHNYM